MNLRNGKITQCEVWFTPSRVKNTQRNRSISFISTHEVGMLNEVCSKKEFEVPEIQCEFPEIDFPDKDSVIEFLDELRSNFHEAEKYTKSSYMRTCALYELYEILDGKIENFKDVPRLAKIMTAIRTSCLRILQDVGTMSMKYGKDRDCMEALTKLSSVLLSVLSKLGNE